MRSKVRTALLTVAAGAAAGSLAACGSTNSVSVVSAKTTAATPTTASSSSSPTRPAKPASEQVPDSKFLTVTLQIVPGSTVSSSSTHSVTITDPAKIAQIATTINALPTLPLYPKTYCPMQIDGPHLVLAFRDSASGPVLAQVKLGTEPTGRCSGGVQVTVNGTVEPQLDDAAQPKLYSELMQSAGLTVH